MILRGHPELSRSSATGVALERLRRDRARTGRPHVFGVEAQQMTMVEAMNASDALISDVSALAVDYLASGKPFALTDMRGNAADSVGNSPMTRAAYLIAADASDCDRAVTRLLAGGSAQDEKRSLRIAVRDYYLAPDVLVAVASRYIAAETSDGTPWFETLDATV